MKAMVDKETCIGCGLCPSVCPEVFSMDGEGKAEATTDIPSEMNECSKEAAEQCPVAAIRIIEQ